MNKDIAEKLRLIAAWHTPGGPTPDQPCPRKHEVCAEAADELEADEDFANDELMRAEARAEGAATERKHIRAANDAVIRAGVRAFQSGYKDSDPLADWRAFLSAVLDRA